MARGIADTDLDPLILAAALPSRWRVGVVFTLLLGVGGGLKAPHKGAHGPVHYLGGDGHLGPRRNSLMPEQAR